MKAIYDTIVIGGGIYGAASAYFLKNKSNKVLLIEKEKIGSAGATKYSRGITRVFDPVESLSKLSYESLQYFLNWEKHNFPGKTPYSGSGFVYLMDEKDAERASSFSNKMSSKEYPIEILDSKTLNKRYPWIKTSKGKIGIFEKFGGYGSPTQTAINFSLGFADNGGEVYENCGVKAIERHSEDLWDVVLDHDTIQCRSVVVTVGAFTKTILPDLPVFTRSISLAQLVDHTNGIDVSLIDETIETYIRPNGGGSFYAGCQVFEIEDTPDLLKPKSREEVLDSINRLNDLIQKQGSHQAFNSMKGFDGYTTEKAPILQFLNDKKGLYVAAGFSGRGYKCCISIAKQISEHVQSYLDSESVVNNIEWRYKVS